MIGETNGTIIPGPQALVAAAYTSYSETPNGTVLAANRDYWDLRDCKLAPSLEII